MSVALEESFPLKDIDKRLEQRILKFFQREYRKKFKLPLDEKDDLNQTRDLVTITRGASDYQKGGAPFKTEERILADLDVSDIHTNDPYMHDANATMNLDAAAITGHLNTPPKGFTSGQSRQMVKVIDKYKHKSMHTLYVLKPGSLQINLLNFKQQSFAKERLNGRD